MSRYATTSTSYLLRQRRPPPVNATVGLSIDGPVTKRIDLPDGWDDLVDEYTVGPDRIKSSRDFDSTTRR